MAKKSLLLVDADSKSLRMLEVSLRKSGFSVTTAIHAADAREKLRHAQPDLIITDTKLPGDENGFDFVANLKSQPESANIPIIFLSSENRLEQKVTGLELGVEDYLTKPIYIKEVLTRVRVLLDKREKQTLEKRERSSSFAGLLGDMGLVDLMQTVEIGRKSGRLFIETRSQKGQVSFKEGKVTDARSGRLAGERAFYRMLVWNEGSFSMEFGGTEEADVIELSTQGLLMEGMRRVDEWGRLIEQLPPLDHIFEIDFNELVDRLAEIPDEINMLLRLFDGRRTMLQVVDETDFGDLEALEIASKLYFEGLIFDCTDREPPEVAEPHKVEAWLQEPAGASVDDEDEDEDPEAVGQLLVPAQDSVPPMPAPSPRPGTPILAPPSGAAPTAPPASSSSNLASNSVPLPRTPTSSLPMALPKTASSLLPMAGGAAEKQPLDPVERVPVQLPKAPTPRPLPKDTDEVPENRAVVPRSAVGATAWSSKRGASGGDDDDGWEDIVAPDEGEHTPADGLSLVSAPPPPPLLPLTATPMMMLNPLTSANDRASQANSSSTSASSEPASPAAAELARDLGLSDDELALALSAHENDNADGAKTDTIVDAADADEGDPLAAAIAAQLGDPQLEPGEEDPKRALPPELKSEMSSVDAVESAAERDTDKGRKKKKKKAPPPTPDTSTPSSAPAASAPTSTTTNDTVPAAAASDDVAAFEANIHDRRTKLDIDTGDGDEHIERFGGVSKAQAAAVFAIGFVVVAGLVVAFSGGNDASVKDAGSEVVDVVKDAGAVVVAVHDAGVVEAVVLPPPIVDAGVKLVPPAVVDAGVKLVVPPPAVDAGPKKDPNPNPNPNPTTTTADPQAEYTKHLKAAEAFAKKGDFGKSVRSYKSALAVDKDALAAHLGLGNAYYELDNLEASLFHLERARALAPGDPQVFVLLGAVYQSAGRKADAISAYERYLELAPSGKFARDVKGILRGLKN